MRHREKSRNLNISGYFSHRAGRIVGTLVLIYAELSIPALPRSFLQAKEALFEKMFLVVNTEAMSIIRPRADDGHCIPFPGLRERLVLL